MSEINFIKLSDLIQQVEDVVKLSFGGVSYWVVAEISGHKFYPNNDRHYFEFIEKSSNASEPIAKVRGVSWTAGSQHIRTFETTTGQAFTNGIEVLVKVKVDFHKSYGFQLTLLDIDASFTLGKIALQRKETLLKLLNEYPAIVRLEGDHYVTRNNKLALPAVIQHIAIIGSPNSEGYIDFTHTLSHNQFSYTFSIDNFQSSVQGVEAAFELVNKLIDIHQSGKKYDCVVIIRGGGSKSDFLVFDTFKLALAIAKFPIPVITGIGHHNDVSIVDMMAHTHTKTPTKAAEFIISHNRNFEESLHKMEQAVVIKSQQLVSRLLKTVQSMNMQLVKTVMRLSSHQKDDLQELMQLVIQRTKGTLFNRQSTLVSMLNKISTTPKIITSERIQELNAITAGIKVNSGKMLVNSKGYLGHYVAVIRLLSPDNILKRGFAIISHKGRIINDADTITPGDQVTITMKTTILGATIQTKQDTDGNQSQL